MTIKEVSEKYGITQDTLRYYERVGMIPQVTRTAGGIRNYSEEDLRWVELANSLGFLFYITAMAASACFTNRF